jgi:hypothetical protein
VIQEKEEEKNEERVETIEELYEPFQLKATSSFSPQKARLLSSNS